MNGKSCAVLPGTWTCNGLRGKTLILALPLSNWVAVDGLIEISPGQFQFTDTNAPAVPARFYRVLSP